MEPALSNQISQHLAAGETKEAVFISLLQAGYKVDAIAQAFSQGPTTTPLPDNRTAVTNAVVIIGALLISAGIFSFIAANWQALGSSAKILVILSSLLASYSIGWVLHARGRHITGHALILLGAVIFGAGIFLIGQIFHLRANWPDGFIIWMIGILPLAVMIKSLPIFSLSGIVGAVALFGHPLATFSPGHLDYLPVSTALLLIAFISSYLAARYLLRQSSASSDV